MKKLWKLFYSMLVISAFTFGGGYVIATLIKKKFVDKLNWLDEAEMLDMIALGQSAPGPLALNVAVQVGWKVCGVPGMIVTVIAMVLPPLVTLSIVSYFYERFADNEYVAPALKGMQAGVAAVITDVVIGLASKIVKAKSWLHTGVMVAAFAVVMFTDVNVVFVLLGAAVVGVGEVVWLWRKGKNA